ncbi:MAG: hypothetical protein JW720_14365, partial [Sedimentisphaerales bacterium]|nr:hypothetical protein [Sedimentisphaerales bacterium]
MDDSLRQLVQRYVQTGKQQLEEGSYAEAVKTFGTAQGYREYLTVGGQTELRDLLEKAEIGAVSRKRVDEAFFQANELIKQDQLQQAKAQLELIQSNQTLTDAERKMLPEALRQLTGAIRDEQSRARQRARNASRNVRAKNTVKTTSSKAQNELEKRQKEVAELYYRSLGYYEMGQLQKARDGFVKVIASGLIPPKMVESLEGYIAAIDSRMNGGAGAGNLAMPKVSGTPRLLDKPKAQNVNILAIAEPETPAFNGGAGNVEGQAEEVSVAGSREPQPVTEKGGYIEVVLRKRNIIRSHTKAVVEDAIRNADASLAKGDFDDAKRTVAIARFTVNENEIHLGDTLFTEYSSQLNAKEAEAIDREARWKAQVEEKARQDAIEAERKLREQMERDKEERIAELMHSAKVFMSEGQYEAALGQLEALLTLDPLDDEALTLKDTLKDMIYFKKENKLQREADRQRAESLLNAVETGIPYSDDVTYPKNWREIVERPTRRPDEPIGLDPEDMAIDRQLQEIVDLSALTPTMPFSAAIDEIKNAVDPPLTIVVLWRDLYDQAEVEPMTEINMDGLPAIRLGTGLANLLKAVTGDVGEEIGYVIDDGVITIATVGMLPSKLETRVYDISDLAGQQANFQGMGGMGMMGMGMMGMGGMGG